MKELWETDFLSYYHNCDSDKQQTQVGILTTMFEENLDHARHVENERMSLAVAITALVAAILAFGSGLDGWILQILIYTATLVILVISLSLTMRWNSAFDMHLNHARGCYACLQKLMFDRDDDDEEKPDFRIRDSEISDMFCFDIGHEKLKDQIDLKHTRGKFIWLYLFMIAIIVAAMVIVVVEHINDAATAKNAADTYRQFFDYFGML